MGRPRLAGIPLAVLQLHEVDALLVRQLLLCTGGGGVAHVRDLGMTAQRERVVVDRVLAVQRAHDAVGGHDQRVDLDQQRLGVDERAVGLLDDPAHLADLVGRDAGRGAEPGDVAGQQPGQRIDVPAHQQLRRLGGHPLDLDAALGRQHQQRALGAAIEGDREVVLARDLGRALDPHPANGVALDVHAEDLRRLALGLIRPVRQLDAAGLAAAADQHLRLDDHLTADLLSRPASLRRCGCQGAVGYGDAEPLEQLLALVFVQIHAGAECIGGGCVGLRQTVCAALTYP